MIARMWRNAAVVGLGGALALGIGFRALTAQESGVKRQSIAKDTRLFEMRTYQAAPGKLSALHARFRDHTSRLFAKHGLTVIGYWVPTNKAKGAENTLVYILAAPSLEARDKSFAAFRADPEWIAVKNTSEKDGKLVDKVESVYFYATDYSPIK